MRHLFILLFILATGALRAQTDFDSLAREQVRMREELVAQQRQVEELDSQVRRAQYDLEKSRKEALTLRSIMKGYIAQIDSLHRENRRLRGEK